MATRDAVEAAGGVDIVIRETGLGKSQVYRCMSVNEPDSLSERHADIVDSLRKAGEPLILKARARLQGGVFVQLPDALGDVNCIVAGVVELAGELGEVSDSVREAIHSASELGAAISASEAAAIDGRLEELIGTAMAMRLSLQPIREGKKGRRGK
ncbi:hypothetical protein PX699_00510 [Sphingobium sp. H39-3-25]|uniref:hypothetical protein n=1 Tax=Sphingobium arseniciresistens TaxID=3030834 RepID=UPI0023BA1C39|nr:hypothetical protein [Sphingobium arseniciresistens]